VHDAAAWLTVNVLPPTVSVPLRDEVNAFAPTLNDAVPLPEPLAPAVTVIHPALLTVVHAQPVAAETVVDPEPPAAPVVSADGEIVGEHGAPASLTVKVCPPMVSVPLRGVVDVFAVALKPTLPGPLPLAPDVTVSHPVLLLVAVQLQPAWVVTPTLPVPPGSATDCDVEASEYVQAAAAWLTVNVLPPIVSVPLRGEVTVLASTVNDAVPLAVPLAPAVTVIQLALLTAVHAHPVTADTVADPEPPVAAALSDDGEIEGVQGAPASLTVNVWPPIVTVPLRGVVLVFAGALNPTVPLPLPLAPDVTVSHALLLVAVHAQPVGAVIPTLPVPPVPATDCDAAESANVHGTPASWTFSAFPPIVTEPVRAVAVALAVALIVTEAEPVPGDPAVTVSQGVLLLVAVQPQPAGDVTLMIAGPPLDVSDTDVGEMLEVHATPAWVTVNVCPAIVSVPVRAEVDEFAADENVTDPLLVPVAPAVTVIHEALLTAVHVQPVPAVTVVLPAPPAAAIDWLAGEIVGEQGTEKENVFDGRLVDDPPGPLADTRPSYITPPVSGVVSSDTKLTRIMPSASGVGLPRGTVCTSAPPEM
jgi:hypothetical protein